MYKTLFMNQYSHGTRLKIVRRLTGMGRESFCELVGIGVTRLTTIENNRSVMYVTDLDAVTSVFPEFTWWLISGKALSAGELERSANEYCNFAAATIRRGITIEDLLR